MRLLLDTHAWLWWLSDDRRLGKTARQALANPRSEVYVSAASAWEIGIEMALGKLRVQKADLAVVSADLVFEGYGVSVLEA